MMYSLSHLLKALVDQKGSDLHITANSPPRIRIDGSLVKLQVDALSNEQTKELCYSVLTDYQKEKFEKNKELDIAFTVAKLARFRANIYVQRGAIAGVFRLIPSEIKSLDDLKLPAIFKDICAFKRGLVLVTGPTGSGKSTTIAGLLDYINSTRRDHIVTIEDPVEFVHEHKSCLINHREIGNDTYSYEAALKSALRQDPDVVLVGELRDLETVSAAITTGETGHLVFASLHTNGCVQTLNRIVDVFPSHQQDQIKTQLGMTLQAVISQQLVPKVGGGRVQALEIMVANPAIKALVGEGKFNQIYSYIQSGQAGSGMQTMNQALMNLLNKRQITMAEALDKSPDIKELQKLLGIDKKKPA